MLRSIWSAESVLGGIFVMMKTQIEFFFMQIFFSVGTSIVSL